MQQKNDLWPGFISSVAQSKQIRKKNKVYLFPLFIWSFISIHFLFSLIFFPPLWVPRVHLYVICLLSHIACSAPLFHLGLLLHVDKQVVFFFFFLFWNWQGYLQWNFHFGGFSKHWAWCILLQFALEWRYTDILIWIFFSTSVWLTGG